MDRVTNEAWVTLCTNDVYAVGALVLASSLQRVGSTRQKAVLVGPDLSLSMRERLSEVFDWVEDVNVLDSHDSAHLALMARPELGITFTKMHCWKLIQYEKAVFLDADTLVLRNCDELFDREEFSAAPDAGWPDCFNTGVFVYTPSLETYHNLLQFAVDHGSFDGADQGLLNLYFSEWATGDIAKRLPFVYNMSATSVYTYLPAYRQFGRDVRIVHFLGTKKPWQCTDAASSQAVHYSQDHLNSWWHIFREDVQRLLSLDMSRDAQIPLLQTSALAHYVEDKHVVSQDREREAPPTLVMTSNTYQYYHHQAPSTSLPPPPAQIETPPTRREWEELNPSPAPLASSASSPVEVGMHAQEVVETCSGYDWFTPELETESDNVPEVERDQQRQQLLLLPRQEQVAHEPETEESATEAPSPAPMPKNPNPSSSHMSEAHHGVVATMSALSVGEAATVSSNLVNNEERSLLQNRGHREAWERGEIDYRGRDSFDSIMAKINETLRRSASKESVPVLAE